MSRTGVVSGVPAAVAAAVLLLASVVAGQVRPAPVPPISKQRPLNEEQKLLLDVSVPPLARFNPSTDKLTPPSAGKTDLRLYADAPDGRKGAHHAVRKAQLLLWASSPATPPKQLFPEVQKLRKELKQLPSPLRGRVPVPPAGRGETALQQSLLEGNKTIARVVARLESAAEELEQFLETRERECPRVQAQLAFYLGCVRLRIVSLEEHAAILGRMRKEWPDRGKEDRAWELRSQERLSDSAGRKQHKAAAKLMDEVIRQHPNTVWEAQARQAQREQFGLTWQAVR